MCFLAALFGCVCIRVNLDLAGVRSSWLRLLLLRSKFNVHASFPHAVALGTDLNVHPSNWRWVHCLTLPVETLNALKLSQRPHKWIRYVIGAIIGAEGELSTSDSPDLPNVVDYNVILPAE